MTERESDPPNPITQAWQKMDPDERKAYLSLQPDKNINTLIEKAYNAGLPNTVEYLKLIREIITPKERQNQ